MRFAVLIACAALLVTPAAQAATPEEQYEAGRVVVEGDHLVRGGQKLAVQQFLREAGREDLSVRIDDAKNGGLITGGVLGGSGILLGIAGWGAFVGFTVASATNNDPDLVAPALLGAFGGTCLCLTGLAAGGGVAAYSQVVEPQPFEPGELERAVDEHNQKLKASLGLTTAMRF